MTMPRFSIAALMFVVLFAALEFGVIRALNERPASHPMTSELLILGSLPMANVLGIAIAFLLAGQSHPGPRRAALLGFVRFGLVAWLAFMACAILAPSQTRATFDRPILASQLAPGLPLASFAALVLALPQLALAGLGWWIAGRYVIRWSFAVERSGGGTVIQLGNPTLDRPDRNRVASPAGQPDPG